MYGNIGIAAAVLLILILLVCSIRLAVVSFKKDKWWIFSVNVATTYALLSALFIIMGGI